MGHKFRLFGFLALLTILAFGICFQAQAQSSGSTTGTIIGKVIDPQGATVVGATVTARQVKTNFSRTTTVAEDGIYQFAQLPPGDYEIKAQSDGFVTGVEPTVVNIGTTSLIEFTLSIKGTTDVVE